ncbi:MAG: DegT/DnrJ/EryC1/StrS family aminotransferase [Gammaproteobacteria bacterium]
MNYPFAKPYFSEELELKAINDVYNSGIFVHGKQSKKFEENFRLFTGSRTASSVANCTAGLHLAHHILSSPKKGKVICPAMTHVATANAIVLSGNVPFFVDCELDSGNIDIQKIKEVIDDTFVGISIVHFNGSPCNMNEIMEIVATYNLYLVEDCALAIGAKYENTHVGLFGDFGCFSFHPAKQLCTGEGGMIISKDDYQESIDLMKAFGVDRSFTERLSPGQYDVSEIGFNYRMPEIPAALGLEQMKKADFILKQREKNYQAYLRDEELASRALIQPKGSSRYSFIFMLDSHQDRSSLQKHLSDNGIGSSVYYPSPVPNFLKYKEMNYEQTDIKNALKISNHSLAMPVGPHLTTDDIDYITNVISNFIKTL